MNLAPNPYSGSPSLFLGKVARALAPLWQLESVIIYHVCVIPCRSSPARPGHMQMDYRWLAGWLSLFSSERPEQSVWEFCS